MVGKFLVIAEKPSVMGDIARQLGRFHREKEYYENDEYVISSAVGHLLEIAPPEGAEVKRGKWKIDNLPVLPDYFDLIPIKKTEARLNLLKRIYRRADIVGIINACDAGREGELIFSHLIRHISGKKAKPVQRLWLQSMTPASIRRGFTQLRKDEEMKHLRQAAECRAHADWLVGINATRAMTAVNSHTGEFNLTTVGRVQTPTLAVIVTREEAINRFKPQQYWQVEADFLARAGTYHGVWIAPPLSPTKKKGSEQPEKPERITREKQAQEIATACAAGNTAIVSQKVKIANESPPPLFDLTSLQREANTRFGLAAKSTLAIAQALYEKHKQITYPRTDSRALPEDYVNTVQQTLQSLCDLPEIGVFARKALESGWVLSAGKKVFNNAKVSDHFAIVPTDVLSQKPLPALEQKIYDLIVRRFIAVFFPPAQFQVAERRTVVKGTHTFLTRGRVLITPGWRQVAGKSRKDDVLTPVSEGEQVTVQAIDVLQKETQPPRRYTEATLLSVMETAGKLVEDEGLREAMRERGLGTPATRASIIERLIQENYIVRDGQEIIPTRKALSLLYLLSALGVDALTQPKMTGEWEYKLKRMEKADFDHGIFMQEIHKLTTTIVDAAKKCGNVDDIPGHYALLKSACPVCTSMQVKEWYRKYACTQCDFFVRKTMGGRELSVAEVEALFSHHTTGELTGFRSRQGRPFTASIVLRNNDAGKLQAVFHFDQPKEEVIDAAILPTKTVLGKCPKCQASVRHLDNRYACEKAAGENATCDFVLAARILQRPITPQEASDLLSHKKTKLLAGFVSKRTKRSFKAYLTLDVVGKIGFEFATSPAKRS